MSLLPLPAFAAEMGLPANRPKLEFSIRSGYAIVAAFALFSGLAHVLGLLPMSVGIAGLIALKLTTNTVAWWALRRDWLALELCGLNVLADILAMTGAIYITGAVESPLVAVYGIELTVVALLTNVGVTVATSLIAFACYATMLGLVRAGVLDAPRTLPELAGGIGDAYLAVMLLFVAFVIGLPTASAAAILERLRAQEAALLARSEQLVEAGRQRSQFMANVTHELRTPIHGICGLADLVDAGVYGPVTAKQKSAVEDIKGSALSLLRLIDDLLTLSREDAGRLEYRPAEFDTEELLASVLATVGFLRGTRALDVQLDVDGALPAMTSDRGKLAQILVNLLANAVKFTPDGGHVVLRARRLGTDRIELAVIDDGIGIPASEHERIFEPFRQVDGSKERRYGGTGLGLALVRRLTTLLAGEIRVESEEGRGSTFYVTLPIRGPAATNVTGRHRPVAA